MRRTTCDRLLLIAAVIIGLTADSSAQQAVEAERFVVASGHPDATAVGLAVLRSGGNVVDAALATSLALGVAEPYGSGIGGKGMLLYRDAKTGRVYSIEAMCAAPDAIDPGHFSNLRERDRYYGYTSVGVPGLVAALDVAHRKWGSQPWRDVVMPAAELADRGVAVSEKMYQLMRPKRNLLRRDEEAARIYLNDGETPAVGAVMKYPDLAQSLRLIAECGAKVFYKGPIAERIVATAEKAGAPLTMDDFRCYAPRWTEPLVVDYDGFRIYTCPPPLTGGVTVLSTLRALDGVAALDITSGRDPKYIDLVGRVLLSVYPRVTRTIADVPSAVADAHTLFADESVRSIRQEAEAAEPAKAAQKGSGFFFDWGASTTLSAASRKRNPTPWSELSAEASTTHLIVADRKGNIVCLTQSLSYHFGACVVAPGTGVLLNDSMSNFSTSDPDGCNYVAPGKHERSTIAPIIATRIAPPRNGEGKERVVLALGIPGGQRIPTTTIQLLTDILHFETPLAETFDRSRFHVRRPRGSEEAANIVDLEEDAPEEFDEQLTAMGWQVERHLRNGGYFGGGSAVLYETDGKMRAVADLRRTNAADGE
jgi:gamma-glutamyltranspeptidase/glutathione hydrolase